jgi:hypothetical protein
MPWRDNARCRGMSQRVFFPGGLGVAQYENAKSCCGECPVREECLAECMATEADKGREQRHGMFGGLTPPERVALARGTTAHNVRRCGV